MGFLRLIKTGYLRKRCFKVMSQDTPLILQLLASSTSIAEKAGNIIRDVMSKGQLGIVEKGKNDLQTEADRSAQRFIVSSLAKQFPDIAIIGEEGDSEVSDDSSEVPPQDKTVLALSCPSRFLNVTPDQICVWVDPLDGTAEYTEGLLDHVTVLIGIAVGNNAVAGVIHQPYYNYQSGGSLGRTLYGLEGGGVGGFQPKSPPSDGNIIATTRSHSTGLVNQVLQVLEPTEVLRVGGAGYKVLLLMEGKAHSYVFASPGCKRWDTCAPEAILREMGGELTDMLGQHYDYSKNTPFSNSRGVLATAQRDQHSIVVSKVAAPTAGKFQ